MASPATASPTNQAKKGIKWNNVFGSVHRRSRSMTGLNRANSSDALRSTNSLETCSGRDAEVSTPNSLDHTQAIAEEEEGTHISPSVSPKSSIALPPRRPKPAPRLWTEPAIVENTLQGLETVIAPSPIQLQAIQSSMSQGMSFVTPSSGSTQRTYGPRTSSRSHERSLSSRRKGSVAELDLGSSTKRMKTVPDTIVDSPILGSQSFKAGRRTPKTPAIPKDCPTPRAVASDPQLSETRQEMESPLKTPQWDEKSQRRASSMLLPSGLAPLVVPSMPARTPPVPPLEPLNTDLPPPTGTAADADPEKKQTVERKEDPPKVPPKSPRTLLRAFPAPKPGVASSGTPSTSHTANSSISSVSPIETPISALTNATWSPMAQIPSPGLSKTEEELLPVHADPVLLQTRSESPRSVKLPNAKFDRPTEALSPFQTKTTYVLGAPKHSRNNSSSANTVLSDHSVNFPYSQSQHQRMVSESSVMNRGRPMKRGDVSLQRSISRSLKMAFINGSFGELPKGYKRGQLPDAMINNELYGLRRDAEELASSYEILTQLQIANLNQEIRLLEENCDQIRQTISGLREARKGILRNMRMYPNVPGDTVSLREQMVKQETAISDMSNSVDDWTMKLEAAMTRKQMVQLKLSQHIAGVLAFSPPHGDGGRISEEQTPPRSPERKPIEDAASDLAEERSVKGREDREVESIRIYADSGVASLLRSIEQEIDMMDQSRRQGS